MANESAGNKNPVHEIETLIGKYQAEKEEKSRPVLFFDFVEAITENFGMNPPQGIHAKVLSVLDENASDGCLRLGRYYEALVRYDEAIKYYNKSVEIDNNYKSLCNLGTLYSYLNDYEKAISHFKLALNGDIPESKDRQRITYNYGFTLGLSGDYEKAREVYINLTDLFENTPETDRGIQFWLDYGDHCLYNLADPVMAVENFKNGLSLKQDDDRQHLDLLLGIVNASNKCITLISYKERQKIHTYRRIAKFHFSFADQMIKGDGVTSKEKRGELNFYNKNFEEAKKFFEELLKKDITTVGTEKGDVFYFLGLCNLYLEKYSEAIGYFKQSMHVTHALYTAVHLSKCHLKLSNFKEAEELLDTVLFDAPYDTNALMSQVFLYIDWADNIKTTNAEKAINYFNQSIEIATRLLEQKDEKKFQRNLTFNEIDELKYSVSYCHVEGSKLIASRSSKVQALEQARKFLSDLGRTNDNAFYFRSNRVLQEVEKIIDDFNRSIISRKGSLIWTGLIAAIIALFMIFVGKPVIRTGYLLDSDLLSVEIKVPKSTIDSTFSMKRFSSKALLENYVKRFYSSKFIPGNTIEVIPKNSYFNTSFDPVESGYVILVLSISIVFLLLGFLSSEIKMLKVGVIEIEKSDHSSLMDQVELKMVR
jgi:tetratricopeptide (TPR) repeat protein